MLLRAQYIDGAGLNHAHSSLCICTCVCTRVYGEVRGQCCMSSLIILHLKVLRQDLSFNNGIKQLANEARLPGWRASRVLLFQPPQYREVGTYRYTQLLHVVWGLNSGHHICVAGTSLNLLPNTKAPFFKLQPDAIFLGLKMNKTKY